MKIFAALLILTITGCNNKGTPFAPPIEAEVSAISAHLFNLPDRGEDIERFEVPQAYWKQILGALAGAEHDSNSMKWQVLGNVVITHATGTTEVGLFRTGQQVGAFRADGEYYRGSSDSELIQLITAAKKQQSEQGVGGLPATPQRVGD